MAKTKKKKEAEGPAKLNKAEVRAYHKENGWRATVSHFGIAPKDLSPIVNGGEGAKAPKKKEKKDKVEKAKKKKKKSSADAPYGLKKDGTPRKPPGRKGGEASGDEGAPKKKRGRPKKVEGAEASEAPKKRGRPKKNADSADVPAAPKKRGRPKKSEGAAAAPKVRMPKADSGGDGMLDWLIAFRKRNPGASVDCAIVELALKNKRI